MYVGDLSSPAFARKDSFKTPPFFFLAPLKKKKKMGKKRLASAAVDFSGVLVGVASAALLTGLRLRQLRTSS